MNSLPVPVDALGRELQAAPGWRIVLNTFLQTLDSEQTKRAYRRAVESAMDELCELDSLTAPQLTAYRERWVSRLDEKAHDQLSPASVALHLAALRSFLKFARLTGQTPLSKEMIEFCLKSPHVTVVKPYQVPNEQEVRKLLVAARGSVRDRMLLEIAEATGLREAELANLKVGDLTIDDDGDLIIRVRMGKGRKDRLVPLEREAAALLRAYLAVRKLDLASAKDANEYLFVSRKGKGHGKLSPGRIRQLIIQYRKKAKLTKRVSMHSFRHRRAINWLRNGGDVVAVQKLLGHANLSTTQKYLDHLELKELKRVVNARKGHS